MQTGAPPDSEEASQAGEARPEPTRAPAPRKAEASRQILAEKAPSNGNGKDPDPRFEATRKATIMIVDDEAIIVEILKSVLEDAGYRRFIETTESTRALELLADNKPDVVFLDVNRSFPVGQLKIDRSFVKDVPNNADNAAIVASFIPMTHSLGLTVVADGVESNEQLEFLKDRGCDEYQGELLSKPVQASDLLSKVMGDGE